MLLSRQLEKNFPRPGDILSRFGCCSFTVLSARLLPDVRRSQRAVTGDSGCSSTLLRVERPLLSPPTLTTPRLPSPQPRPGFSSSSSPFPFNILLGCCNSPIMTPGAPDAGNVAKRCVYKHSSAVLNKCAGNAALRGNAALSARATATGCKTNAKQSKDKLF